MSDVIPPSPPPDWDSRYAEPGWAFGTEPNDFLREHTRLLPPKGRVLCLAEGEGRNAVHVASLGHDVTAVDISAVGMGKAAALAGLQSELAGLTWELAREIERDVIEARYHHGRSEVVRLVERKPAS